MDRQPQSWQSDQDEAMKKVTKDLAYLYGWVLQRPHCAPQIAEEIHAIAVRCMEEATPGINLSGRASQSANFPASQ